MDNDPLAEDDVPLIVPLELHEKFLAKKIPADEMREYVELQYLKALEFRRKQARKNQQLTGGLTR